MNLTLANQTVPLATDRDGVVRVSNTRVTLETVVGEFTSGATAEQIAQDYPVLDLVDVYAVITYYLQNHPEVEQYLAEQSQEEERIRSQMEARFDPRGVRDRLMARKKTG